MLTTESFVARVETFLRTQKIKAATLGKEALGDSAFVLRLRRGRSPSLDTVEKVLKYMADRRNGAK